MDEPKLPENERTYLRELAKKQAEIAALPLMDERRKMWFALNDGEQGARPPVIIETWTFDRDFMPGDIYKCESPEGRGLESGLLRNIRNHELINDDKVIPDFLSVWWAVESTGMGVRVNSESVPDGQGYHTGYKLDHPITDLKSQFELLKPVTHSVNREATMKRKEFLEDLVGDILPVKLVSGAPGPGSLTYSVFRLMGLEGFFMAMHDSPDEMHRLMEYLRDNVLRSMQFVEDEGLLSVNNGNQSNSSSYNFTTKLPSAAYGGPPAKLSDMWGQGDSQETIGVSPEMFHEFCFPYYRDCCESLGLLYYGCCEPADVFWDDISSLPHLKKVSISPWCNEKFMGDALRGTEIVFSRKPDPNFLSVDERLDEERWGKHIDATLDATRDVFMEIIIRDVYTLHGDINNARRAVEIARERIDERGF